jgi:hypothetical protein
MLSLELVVFLIASLISVGVVYLNIPKNVIFVSLSIIVASMLVLYNKYPISYLQQKENRLMLLLGLFISGLFIQLLLIATGGFFSAFIIMLHLYTLGMSFLFNVKSAMAFLMLSLGVLVTTVIFDSRMQQLFKDDPWSFILHGISFLVVIPLAHIVVSTYQMKDALSKMLTEHLATKELQDESIFKGIGEFVIIADKNLNVIFANEALKKSLDLETAEIVGESIFSVLPLGSQTGIPADMSTLSIEQAIADRAAHKVKGFHIVPKNGGKKMPVLIQVRPIFEDTGVLKQVVFVLTPDQDVTSLDAVDNKLLAARRSILKSELEKELLNHNDPQAVKHFLLLMAQIDDILLYQDLEIYGNVITPHKMLINGVDLLKSSADSNVKFLNAFHLNLDLEETQEALVSFTTQTGLSGFSLYSYKKHNFLISVDQFYLKLLIERIFRLLSIVNASVTEKKLIIRVGYNDSDQPAIIVAVQIPQNLSANVLELLSQNYGAKSREKELFIGSGLEGLLAKKIAELLYYNITLVFSQKTGLLQAVITLPPNQQ